MKKVAIIGRASSARRWSAASRPSPSWEVSTWSRQTLDTLLAQHHSFDAVVVCTGAASPWLQLPGLRRKHGLVIDAGSPPQVKSAPGWTMVGLDTLLARPELHLTEEDRDRLGELVTDASTALTAELHAARARQRAGRHRRRALHLLERAAAPAADRTSSEAGAPRAPGRRCLHPPIAETNPRGAHEDLHRRHPRLCAGPVADPARQLAPRPAAPPSPSASSPPRATPARPRSWRASSRRASSPRSWSRRCTPGRSTGRCTRSRTCPPACPRA